MSSAPGFDAWLAALEARHLANLRFSEVTRALRALSSVYVERRHLVARGAALESAGKRAAFALFYGPLHFLAVEHVVRALGLSAPSSIVDLGCGTGAAGAAWAVSAGRERITGYDRHPWAVEEARWTYSQFGLRGRAYRSDLSTIPAVPAGGGVIAAYVLNELPDGTRTRVQRALLDTGRRGPVLALEPIAKSVAPWWEETARAVRAHGGRVDEWKFSPALPPLLKRLDAAAGLDHSELAVRTLSFDPRARPPGTGR